MKKRHCKRFMIPGCTLYYRNKPGLLIRTKYSEDYFPVINLSRGGVKFLCNERLKPGQDVVIKINIPGESQHPEINANIKWVSKNTEQSYRYQTGVAFNAYGNGKNENPEDTLVFLKTLEQRENNI